MANVNDLRDALHKGSPVWVFRHWENFDPCVVILAQVYDDYVVAHHPNAGWPWTFDEIYLTEAEALRAAIDAHSQRLGMAKHRLAQLTLATPETTNNPTQTT
jgi:hypothetical protein